MAELSGAVTDYEHEIVRPAHRAHFLRRLTTTPSGAFGLAVFIILIASAGLADVLAPYSPIKMGVGKRFLPPSFAYPLGTDEFGRDVLSRMMFGSRLTLMIGAIAVGISLTIGMLIGLVAAYRRGWVEKILMRGTDVLFSFTETLIALACVAVLGPSLENAMIAVGIAGIPFYARTCYSAALVERSKPYFEATIAAGAGHFRLIFLHLLPNVLPTMIVVATLGISAAILAAAGLSFLGLGAQPPQPEWGAMLSGARDYFNKAPYLMVIPGVAIAVTVLGFNLLGDAIRNALDPREDEGVSGPVLDVRDLKVAFGPARKRREVVHGVSFTVDRGEVLAIVGESGSGKSVTALSLMGLLPKGSGTVTGGSARFEGEDLIGIAPDALRRIRGERIGMIFQEPMTSLNPVLSIGRQMTEGPIAHGMGGAEAQDQAIAMLERVGIGDAARRLRQFPHEFSGGMRQRVMIAMAMMMKPSLLIADEPTTALDVTIQAQILDLMRALVDETGTSLILITHDMGVVAETADRVLVMRKGRAVEDGAVKDLFTLPRDAYTRALLAAVPRLDAAEAAPPAVKAEPIVQIAGVSKTFSGRTETKALSDISLDVMATETVALVGESGSGKSTLGRAVARLLDVDTGAILVDGTDMARLKGGALRRARAKVQMIFQDPYASLDPRFPVGRTVAEPMVIHGRASRREAWGRAAALLQRVGLDGGMANRYPHEFSGGQRQRVAIARALAAEPQIIVADEPTSALDVSIQRQVLDLLAELRDDRGIALLFISHDLAVVRQISSRIAVMRAGRILEVGPTGAVLDAPRHVYTKALISAAPVPDPEKRGRVRVTVPAGDYPDGPLVEAAPGHWVAS